MKREKKAFIQGQVLCHTRTSAPRRAGSPVHAPAIEDAGGRQKSSSVGRGSCQHRENPDR